MPAQSSHGFSPEHPEPALKEYPEKMSGRKFDAFTLNVVRAMGV